MTGEKDGRDHPIMWQGRFKIVAADVRRRTKRRWIDFPPRYLGSYGLVDP